MIRTIEYKLYPNVSQQRCLARWLRVCCWIYNQALEHRIKAYQRRGESPTRYNQQKMLTRWRRAMPGLRACPLAFERDALFRVDRGFQHFFRRCKSVKGKPGFPRFRPHNRYRSMEYLAAGTYTEDGQTIRIPGMGKVRAYGRKLPDGQQKCLRIIRKPSGWYAQLVIDDKQPTPDKRSIEKSVGIDMGLNALATTSDGEQLHNPRWYRNSQRKRRALQKRISRRQKGSNRRRKAVHALARQHERIAAQRRNYWHQYTTDLVRRYDLIAVEDLNTKGLSRSRFAKSILDGGWNLALTQLESKAENAGVQVVRVNPAHTSQTCPNCGATAPKSLSERTHDCSCGCHGDRDVVAAQVILARALGGSRGKPLVEDSASAPECVAQGVSRSGETRRFQMNPYRKPAP